MSQTPTNTSNLTWAQRLRLTLQREAKTSNRPRTTIGDLPNELLDMIFPSLPSNTLHPFLFSHLTYRSAHRALYLSPLRLVPTSTASRNTFNAIAVLQDDARIPAMPELQMTFPAHRVPGGFMPATSWGEAVNAVLWQWDHWTSISLELGPGNEVGRARWTAFPNLQRLELVGRRDIHTSDHAWSRLATTRPYELVLRGTMLRPGPSPTYPFNTNRIRVLTIHLPRWRADVTRSLESLRLNCLEELSLHVDEHPTTAVGRSLGRFLLSLSFSGEDLRHLTCRGVFLMPEPGLGNNGSLLSPLRPYTSLRELELPIAHLLWVGDMLDAPRVQRVTFGVYDAAGQYISMLRDLCDYLCQHAFSPAPDALERRVTFCLEIRLPIPHSLFLARRYRNVFSHILQLQDRLRRAAFHHRQSVEYSKGIMQLRVGAVTVDFEELYVLGHWQTQAVGYAVEEAFGEFWMMIGS